jgi:AcrR family transcriptional regulator
MRRTAEAAEATRVALIEKGVLTFAEVGYHAARLDDVAERAEVTRGAVYHHFGDKQGLLKAIIDRFIGAFDQSVDGLVDRVIDGAVTSVDGREPIDRVLERLIVEPLALVESDRHAAAFFELVMLRAAGVHELDAVRMHRREIMTGRIEALAAALGEGAQEGRIREDVEPDAIARHIASVQYGVLATWIEFGRTYSLVDEGRTAARLLADAVVRRPRARRNR